MEQLCKDLHDEYTALDEIVSSIADMEWNAITTPEGWTVKDQIGHLAYYDGKARLAVTDAKAFQHHIEEMVSGFTTFEKQSEDTLFHARQMNPRQLMDYWRTERSSLLAVLETLGRKDRIQWYGPSMSAISFATARLMETWAHGQNIVDTLKIKRTHSHRLRHIAHLGVKTFGWSFKNRQIEVPDNIVRVELLSPLDEMWIWGDPNPEECVSGKAQDFFLVVTKRRHVLDTGLTVKGSTAKQWMIYAQAFAGPPVSGPLPETFKN